MSDVIGFAILDATDGSLIGMYDLTRSIDETVSGFEYHGRAVRWEWVRDWSIYHEQFDLHGQCEGCEKWDYVNRYMECEKCYDDGKVEA